MLSPKPCYHCTENSQGVSFQLNSHQNVNTGTVHIKAVKRCQNRAKPTTGGATLNIKSFVQPEA